MAAAVEEPVLTNISEMIDLAIGTPENGVVDFNMLQTVLHCLAQQMRVLGKNVELRGSVAVMPVGRVNDNTQTIAISEFIIDTGTPGKYELATSSLTSQQDSVLVVERKKRSSIPPPPPKEATSKERKKSQKSADTAPMVVAQAPTQTQPAPPQSQTVPPPPQQAPSPPKPTPPQPQPAPPQPSPPQSVQPQPLQPAPPQPGQPAPPPSQTPQPAPSAPPPPQQPAPPSPGHPAPRSAPSPSISREKLSLVTLSKFNVLEHVVLDLKERVYGTSPKNETILQEVRSQSNLKAITEMWTNMNVASRLEAAEEAIGKLSSLIEDLIGETTALQKEFSATRKDLRPVAPSPTMVSMPAPSVMPAAAPSVMPTAASSVMPTAAPSAVATAAPSAVATAAPSAVAAAAPSVVRTAAPSVVATAAPSVVATAAPGVAPMAAPSVAASVLATPSQAAPSMMDLDYLATKDELGQVVGYLQSIRDDLDKLAETFSEALKEVNANFVPPEPHPKSVIVLAPPQVSQSVVSRTQQVPQAPSAPQAPPASQYPQAPPAPQAPQYSPAPQYPQAQPAPQVQPVVITRLQERMEKLETELRKCCDVARKTEGRVKDQLTSFQDQLEYMAKQIAGLTIQGESGNLSPDLIKDLQALMKLFETVQSMQAQLKQVHETALNLAAEKEARQNHIDALLEQIELLKVIKLDREDMVEALADKADLRMLARKVSHDQFENACDDLSKGLEHALGKLNVQESLWQQALDDIQREIEQKLDKMELSPVKDFFNNKLKQLQENLRQMASLRREAEAAGTKRRLLRDVNCISCDANAVMQAEALPPQPSKPLPAHLSMKPYLSYELDAIRKNQANALPQRNMHDWEHVQQQMQPSRPHKVRSETDKHLCNRYCGGSHTTTTPAQRVARLGHFMKQWGPEVLPLSSGFAAGDDGRLYKVSTSEGANVGPGGAVEGAAVCTPKSPVKKQDPSKPQAKPIEITAECRCLDPTAGRPPPQT